MRSFATALPEHVMVSMPALSPVYLFLVLNYIDNDPRRYLVLVCEGGRSRAAW